MGKFIIDSIGFSATHAMAAVLRDRPGLHLTHGSRNFLKATRIGENNLTVSDFISQMLKAEEANEHCVAIHCLFEPTEVAHKAKDNGVTFFGLCRKETKGQVLSGFYWALRKFLNGDATMGQTIFGILQKHHHDFKTLKIPSNYISSLMVYSLQRVVSYNLALADNSEGIIFMEDFLDNPGAFLGLLGIGLKDDEKIDVPRTVSHKKKSSHYDFLADHEETLDTLMVSMSFNYQNNQIKCNEVYGVIAEKTVLKP